MAIAFDASASSNGSSVSSLTFSHTASGSSRMILVGVATQSNSELITGVTYAGVSMTQINKQQATAAGWVYLYALQAPTLGANNVVISFSSADTMWSASVSYTGANQSVTMDATATQTAASGTSYTSSLATVADNCWHILFVRQFQDVISAGAGSTLRQATSGGSMGIFDNNAAITPPGTNNMTINDAGSGEWRVNTISLAPVISAFPSFLLNFI